MELVILMVRGRVSTIRMGRTIAFANPNTNAATTSDDVSEKRMPLKTKLAIQSDKDVTPQWTRNVGMFSNMLTFAASNIIANAAA